MEDNNLKKILFLNNPLRLALLGYFLNQNFYHDKETKYITIKDFFENLSSSLNSINRRTIHNNLEELVKLGYINKISGTDLNNGKKINKKSNYYELKEQNLSGLARYILKKISENNFDYESTILSYVKPEDRNPLKRWNIIEKLYEQEKTLTEIMIETEIGTDTIYDHLRPLKEAGYISIDMTNGEERLNKYYFPTTINENELNSFEKGLYNIFKNKEFTLSEAKNKNLIPEDKYNSFKSKLQRLPKRRNLKVKKTSDKIKLTKNGKLFYKQIISEVKEYFSNQKNYTTQEFNGQELRHCLKIYDELNLGEKNNFVKALEVAKELKIFTRKQLGKKLGLKKPEGYIKQMLEKNYLIVAEKIRGSIMYQIKS